jgi:hypothetical protein
MGNGPVGGNGKTHLLYTIENVKRDEICQNEDIVALPEGGEVKSVFFSDDGVSNSSVYKSLQIPCPLTCYTFRILASMTQPAYY